MKHLKKSLTTFLLLGATGFGPGVQAAEDAVVNFYGWPAYMTDDTLPNFSRQSGIRVVYDVFDTNEVLEAKLLAGNTGYDLVMPGSDFMMRQIKAGVFQELDKSKIPNYAGLDPELMKLMAQYDPGNDYGVPYMWGTTGIGYDVDKVKKVLGADAPLDSWDLVLKPENLEKLAGCGVAFLDNPTEVYMTVLNYLGKDPHSQDPKDYSGAATDLLLKLRPYISYFHSSRPISDLANGEICVALGWSGDIMQARNRAQEAGGKVNIGYTIPKEGALMWFDVMTIPKDAKHPENAHKLINYLLTPEVMGANSNFVAYANPVPASRPFLKPEVADDRGVFPDEAVMKKLFVAQELPVKLNRVVTRSWTRVRTGR